MRRVMIVGILRRLPHASWLGGSKERGAGNILCEPLGMREIFLGRISAHVIIFWGALDVRASHGEC